MSYKALYRKWRPADFSQVYGQDQVTSILKYQIANGRHSHAYLFCGSRGTGKTSCAKILAKALNCLSPRDGEPCGKCEACKAIEEGRAIDVIEMDAASNNRVDDVREIIDNIAYTPAVLKYRVYIVDEVHMLTDSAFNALLKTLEEPPGYIVFVLATTELNRLPATIISRCQRFDFMRIPTELLAERMVAIAKAEGAEITDDGAYLIAKLANGGFRDAISLLEMCISKHILIDEKLVADTLGICGNDVIFSLVSAIANKNMPEIFRIMTETERSSKDIAVFWSDLIDWYRNMIVIKTVDKSEKFLACTSKEFELLKKTADMFDVPVLLYHSRILDSAMSGLKRSAASKRNTAELALIRMCDTTLSDDSDALLARLSELENKLLRLSVGGAIAVAPDANNKNNSESASADLSPAIVDEGLVPPPEEPVFYGDAPQAEPERQAESNVVSSPDWWEDVIAKVSKSNPGAGSFLRGTDLNMVNGIYEIKVRGRTALMYLSRNDNLKLVSDFVSALSGSPVTPDKIKITLVPTSATSRPGDELFN